MIPFLMVTMVTLGQKAKAKDSLECSSILELKTFDS